MSKDEDSKGRSGDFLEAEDFLSDDGEAVDKTLQISEDMWLKLQLEQLESFDDGESTVESLSKNAFSDGPNSTEATPVSDAERLYRELVEEDISLQDRGEHEGTVIVPLGDLARREELRLRDLPATPALPPLPTRAIAAGQIALVLNSARTVEEVAAVLVEIVASVIPRVLLLWERGERLYGFASRGMGLSEVKLLTLEVPREVFFRMAGGELEKPFQGTPPADPLLEQLFGLLGVAPRELLVLSAPVTVSDRLVLYADRGALPLPAFELRLLEVVMARASACAGWLLDAKTAKGAK